MHLVGVDIGFSNRRRSNGIAVFRDGVLVRAERLSVVERNTALQLLDQVNVVAIDAPLLPPRTTETLPRECERVFSRGAFQKRCKPGMSHVRGTGLTLREHGGHAASQLITATAMRMTGESLPHMLFDSNIVEAFPNAFLGVLVPEEDFLHAPKIKRGGKFDWLYNRWIARRLFAGIVTAAGLPNKIAERCDNEKDHDIRAALVCLLTAGLVSTGNYEAIGDETGGYFFLPPVDLWMPWARIEIEQGMHNPNEARTRSSRFAKLEISNCDLKLSPTVLTASTHR
jgi:predicted RNase H-like nuclease